MKIKIALPKGRLLKNTACLTHNAGWGLEGYSEDARLYHLYSRRFPELNARIFQEKDIPIQVAVGNYDLGICGLDWVQEFMVKYPGSNLLKIKNLSYGRSSLFLAASPLAGYSYPSSLKTASQPISIASEYPNLAEYLALNLRLKRFNIFPIWGAAEIYPPENADLIILQAAGERQIFDYGLNPVMKVLESQAYLIANKNSWATRDLSEILDGLFSAIETIETVRDASTDNHGYPVERATHPNLTVHTDWWEGKIHLALPDGHAQKHVVNILEKAGIKIFDYPSTSGNRTPRIEIPGIAVKVIRPQDMPLQVANGKFDIAITGKDWVEEHLYKFPSSPVMNLLDLKYSRVKIVAAIHNDIPVNDIRSLREYAMSREWKLRIASEYVNIADKYARDHHLYMYRIIPTWGATESFLPDDADLLIENTETGNTLRRHNLKIIDTLFESTACLITSTESLRKPGAEVISTFVEKLKKAIEES